MGGVEGFASSFVFVFFAADPDLGEAAGELVPLGLAFGGDFMLATLFGGDFGLAFA